MKKLFALIMAGLLTAVMIAPVSATDDVKSSADLYISFDEGIKDDTGTYTLTENGTTAQIDGKVGKAANFVGGNNSITVNDFAFGSDSFTISTWINIHESVGDPVFLGNKNWDSGENAGIALGLINYDNIFFNVNTAGAARADVTIPGNSVPESFTNTWIYITYVVDRNASTMTTYVNGEMVGDTVDYGASGHADGVYEDTTNQYPLNIGDDGTSGLYKRYNLTLNVDLDELAIFKKALTANEVAALYTNYTEVKEVEFEDGPDLPDLTVPALEGTSSGPDPSPLWDFGETDCGLCYLSDLSLELKGDYATFNASGDDPYGYMDVVVNDVNNIQWAKIRVKNTSAVKAIELYAITDGRGYDGNDCTHMYLYPDTENWYTYLVYLPNANIYAATNVKESPLDSWYWRGECKEMRLDVMWNSGNGGTTNESIDIDYIAFFSNKADAEAFRADQDSAVTLVEFEDGPDLPDLTVPGLEGAGEAAPAEPEPPVETPAEPEAPAESPVDEELDAKAEAPNTFDFGIIAAVAAVVSLGGFALTKKKH